MQTLTILGSTGSIGVSTLNVVARHPQRFRICALTANSNTQALFEQCQRHCADWAVVMDTAAAEQLEQRFAAAGLATRVLCGIEALERVASLPQVDTVMAAIVGIAGLRPTLAAVNAGKKVLLANKESLVTAGALFMDAVRKSGATLLPIDSEHNAVFQTLPHSYQGDFHAAGVRRIILTASGGPFRQTPLQQLTHVTPDQACAHPNWVMGRKISVDSATMMNKGLEVIEARWLFNVPSERIEVVIHPESVVHSLVEYQDGSVLAQLGNPDMRTPIAHALGFPERIETGVDFLDLAATGTLRFEKPDLRRFPCLRLAFDTLRAGDAATIALNAANEVAVARFLAGNLKFIDIPVVIEHVLGTQSSVSVQHLDTVLEIDRQARERAETWHMPLSRARHAGTSLSMSGS